MIQFLKDWTEREGLGLASLGLHSAYRENSSQDSWSASIEVEGPQRLGYLTLWESGEADFQVLRRADELLVLNEHRLVREPSDLLEAWVSFHSTTNIGQFDHLFLQAEPYDAAGDYTQRSPVYHAAKCRTPTLILHGEEDLCTPLPQATEFYNALVEAGCEAELVVYPREGHGWTEREHQLDGWNRMREWLARHFAEPRH